MRLTVTRIGSTRLSLPRVAAAVVDYLEGELEPLDGQLTPRQLLARPREDGMDGVVTYYADSIEGPGSWMGNGSARLELDGLVERDAFQRVLSGRHPVTGVRLLSAVGSAARSPLAVGAATRQADDGEWLYDRHDAAVALGLSVGEVDALAAAGDRRRTTGESVVTWLDTELGVDGERWVRDGELDRFAAEQVDGERARALVVEGEPDDSFSTAQVAAVVGVSAQYVRGACRYWEQHRREIEATVAVGLTPRHAWLESSRDDGDAHGSYRVTRRALAEFVERRDAPVARVGFDLTLTVEKSVGVLTMLTDGARQDGFVAAFDAANATALAYLEGHAAFGRRQGHRVGTEGLVVASYLHGTSRALDPFPHRHNIVANAIIDEAGDRRTLDGRLLFRHAAPAAALATAELRWRLSRQLGVEWVRSPRGMWEIAGVPDAAVREFSTRRREIEDALTELAAAHGLSPTGADADRAALGTRAKKQPTNRRQLLASWRLRARHAGLGRRAIDACFGHDPPLLFERLPHDWQTRLFDALVSPEGVTAQHSTFGRGHVIEWIASWTVADTRTDRLVVVPAREVERLTDEFLASELVIELAGRGTRSRDVIQRQDGRRISTTTTESTFSTVAMLEMQADIVDRFDAGLHRELGVVADEFVEAAVSATALTDEQAALVRTLTASGDQCACAIGRPGTGKTYALGAAARAWEAEGWRVVGAAVKGEAARHLGTAAAIPAETVAWYLAGVDNGRVVFDERTVLLIDEASTLGDRDLAALLRLAANAGSIVRLIGDPAQHGAVPAGGMFSFLCRRYPDRTPELRSNQRLQDPVDERAAEAIRDGHIAEALTELAGAGRLAVVRQGRALYTDMLTRWLAARTAGEGHPMVDRRNKTRLILNHLAHRILQTAGTVARDGLGAADGREFCVGDEVIARRPARHLHPPGQARAHVRNGSTGVIVAVHPAADGGSDALDVDFTHAGVIRLPRSFFDAHPDRRGRVDVGLDHAYAVTSYAVQGATHPASTSAVTAASRRRELYVNLTRGRRDNFLYAVAGSDPLRGEGHLPRPPRPDPVHEIIEAASRPDIERTAWEIDPTALAVARARRGRTLRQLHLARIEAEQRDRPDAGVLRRAERVQRNAVGRSALLAPPADLLIALPARPDAPWMAERFDDAIAAVVAYRTTYAPDRASTEEFGWAVGPRPDDAEAADAWDQAVDSLRAAAIPAALRHVDSPGGADVDVWNAELCERLLRQGTLGEALRGTDRLASVAGRPAPAPTVTV